MTSPYQDGWVSWSDFDNTQLLLSLVGPNSWRGKKPSFIVFYFDGYLSPNGKKTREFLQVADMIRSTPTGLAQYVAPRKATHTLLAELQYISRTQKDSDSNVQAAKEWYQSQSDFTDWNQITVYDNSLVVYDPKNAYFQSLTTFFWSWYSLEQNIRQDQPLWAYTLSKLDVQPIQGQFLYESLGFGVSWPVQWNGLEQCCTITVCYCSRSFM